MPTASEFTFAKNMAANGRSHATNIEPSNRGRMLYIYRGPLTNPRSRCNGQTPVSRMVSFPREPYR